MKWQQCEISLGVASLFLGIAGFINSISNDDIVSPVYWKAFASGFFLSTAIVISINIFRKRNDQKKHQEEINRLNAKHAFEIEKIKLHEKEARRRLSKAYNTKINKRQDFIDEQNIKAAQSEHSDWNPFKY